MCDRQIIFFRVPRAKSRGVWTFHLPPPPILKSLEPVATIGTGSFTPKVDAHTTTAVHVDLCGNPTTAALFAP